jgi:hypothetical protein
MDPPWGSTDPRAESTFPALGEAPQSFVTPGGKKDKSRGEMPVQSSSYGHLGALAHAQTQGPWKPEVAKHPSSGTYYARLQAAAEMTDRRLGENDRVLDLRSFDHDVGPDRGVGADVGVAQVSTRADDRGPADEAGLEAGGGMDGDGALDAGVEQVCLDWLALHPLEGKAVSVQQRLSTMPKAPPAFRSPYVYASAVILQAQGEDLELLAGPGLELLGDVDNGGPEQRHPGAGSAPEGRGRVGHSGTQAALADVNHGGESPASSMHDEDRFEILGLCLSHQGVQAFTGEAVGQVQDEWLAVEKPSESRQRVAERLALTLDQPVHLHARRISVLHDGASSGRNPVARHHRDLTYTGSFEPVEGVS